MNEKLKIKRSMLLSGLFISSMLAATTLLAVGNLHAQAQSTGNQTENLESVRNSINETLQALQTNDTAVALQSLNEADRQLFEIMRNLPSNAEIEEEGEEEAE
jgi:Skp family chaperone for outer membrane proteins